MTTPAGGTPPIPPAGSSAGKPTEAKQQTGRMGPHAVNCPCCRRDISRGGHTTTADIGAMAQTFLNSGGFTNAGLAPAGGQNLPPGGADLLNQLLASMARDPDGFMDSILKGPKPQAPPKADPP